MKRPGDPIRLGDLIGHPMEPNLLMGRVVAIRKDNCPPIKAVVFRCFRPGDGTFPTGEYRTSWCIVPWTGTDTSRKYLQPHGEPSPAPSMTARRKA